MATEVKDVLRLFITEAAFLGASKRRQFGLDKVTKRLLVHNNTDDTLAVGISDDSLQLLIAGAQDVTGIKTYKNTLIMDAANKIEIGGNANSFIHEVGDDLIISGQVNIFLVTESDDIIFKPNDNLALTVSPAEIKLENNVQLNFNDLAILKESSGFILDVTTAGLKIETDAGGTDVLVVKNTATASDAVKLGVGQGLRLAASTSSNAALTIPESTDGPIGTPSNELWLWVETDGAIHYVNESGTEFIIDSTPA